MKFPGDNRINLSADAIRAMAEHEILSRFGEGVRITDIHFESYPTRLSIEFTTDPELPREPEAPRQPRTVDEPF